jgi:hypothetical protein
LKSIAADDILQKDGHSPPFIRNPMLSISKMISMKNIEHGTALPSCSDVDTKPNLCLKLYFGTKFLDITSQF